MGNGSLMGKPAVSVIIPCYNQGQFLETAIDSALAQNYGDLEVIVINDGSTDETEQVAGRYKGDPRVRLIKQENAGLPAARNRGIQESNGQFLNFLDSDDWLDPNIIRSLVSVLEKNPDVGFAYCDAQVVAAEGSSEDNFSVGKARQIVNGDIFNSLVLGGYFPCHTVLIRKSVLDKIGYFDETLGGNADYYLWLRAAAHGFRALYLDEKLAHYRRHVGSMSLDRQHMEATQRAALEKIARQFPDRLAEAVSWAIDDREQIYRNQKWIHKHYQELKQWIDELQKGKDWLEGQWQELRGVVKARDQVIRSLRQRLKELGASDSTNAAPNGPQNSL
jgi:glycosyltransferase involved in cell wall biosynthesis